MCFNMPYKPKLLFWSNIWKLRSILPWRSLFWNWFKNMYRLLLSWVCWQLHKKMCFLMSFIRGYLCWSNNKNVCKSMSRWIICWKWYSNMCRWKFMSDKHLVRYKIKTLRKQMPIRTSLFWLQCNNKLCLTVSIIPWTLWRLCFSNLYYKLYFSRWRTEIRWPSFKNLCICLPNYWRIIWWHFNWKMCCFMFRFPT